MCDGPHRLALLVRERVGTPKRLAVRAEDVGDVTARRTGWGMRVHARHSGLRGRGDLCGDRIERGTGRGDQARADVHVARGGADGGVSKQDLDDAQVGAGFQAVGRKGVAQGIPVLPMNRPSGRSTIATIRFLAKR